MPEPRLYEPEINVDHHHHHGVRHHHHQHHQYDLSSSSSHPVDHRKDLDNRQYFFWALHLGCQHQEKCEICELKQNKLTEVSFISEK